MARIRTIKPQFWLDQRIATNLTRDERLFYIGLWNQADDEGRFMANPRLLLGVIFPYDEDITERFIESSLSKLAALQRIVLFACDGEEYGEIVKWHDHQRINRPTPSSIPSSSNELCTIHGALSEPSCDPQRGKGKGKGNKERESIRAFEYSQEFELVWKLHHRGPKKTAFEEYKRAVANGIDHDGVVSALKAYTGTLRDGFLGVHLFRWLRDERWQEYDASEPVGNGNGNPKARGRL